MLPPMEVALRMDRLRARLDGAGCDALLVTSTTNIGYLTGFTGSAGLLWVDADRCVLVTDGRYRDQAPQEVASAGVDVEVQIAGADQRANRKEIQLLAQHPVIPLLGFLDPLEVFIQVLL